MKHKILCIGNNTQDTDARCQQVAERYDVPYRGLIDSAPESIRPGCYHSSYYDLDYYDLENLTCSMDLVILLDQDISTYPDEHGFHKSLDLVKSLSVDTIIENTNLAKPLVSDLVNTNPSFCIYPFIQKMTFDERLPCCFSVGHLDSKTRNFPSLDQLREQMLRGEKNATVCSYCYEQEEMGYVSERMIGTKDWSLKYKIYTIEDLERATENYPMMYSAEIGNTCNLMCRTCSPEVSSLIEKENQTIKLYDYDPRFIPPNGLNQIDINKARRVYISGGEPMAVDDTVEFLEKLVNNGKTDIELHFNTNATILTERFKKLIKNFKDVKFTVSIDSFDQKNTYIRWPSSWTKIVKNLEYLLEQGYFVMVNTVMSVYNISDLSELFIWLDQYKNIALNVSDAKPRDGILSAFIRPDAEVILEDLTKITKLGLYNNNKDIRSAIDGYIEYFQNPRSDLERLQEFFNYNDQLDKARGSKLGDYFPKLEQCRKRLTKQI